MGTRKSSLRCKRISCAVDRTYESVGEHDGGHNAVQDTQLTSQTPIHAVCLILLPATPPKAAIVIAAQ